MTANCAECRHPVEAPEDILEGELLVCENCGVELEVSSCTPLELTLFEEEEK